MTSEETEKKIKKPNRKQAIKLLENELREDIQMIESRIADLEKKRVVLKKRFDLLADKFLKIEVKDYKNTEWYVSADFNDEELDTCVFIKKEDDC